jgi:hypothetical protein
VPSTKRHKKDFDALGISEADCGKLYGLFQTIDSDASGSIEILELLMFLDVERTPFTKRIFSMFDDDNSGEIDFREFVLSIWNYCTLGKTSLGWLCDCLIIYILIELCHMCYSCIRL